MSSNPQVVILCGGKGTRLREFTDLIPKPMVKVGEMPIIWHIMKHYANQGFKEFILCLGYKGEVIKDFFLNYDNYASDFTIHLTGDKMDKHNSGKEDWKVTCVNTGLETPTGERILKIAKYLNDSPYFLATYGDGVSDVDIHKVIDFHKTKNTTATLTGVHPHSKYGLVNIDVDGMVIGFKQKPKLSDYINGGFMVLDKSFLNNLKDGMAIEDPFHQLAEAKKLSLFIHNGFWHCMDTHQDYENLNQLWSSGNRPWYTWEK